jgi:hypothetical protein
MTRGLRLASLISGLMVASTSLAAANPPFSDSRMVGLVVPQPAAPIKLNYCVGYAGEYSNHTSANVSFTNRSPLIVTQIQFRYEVVGQDYEPVSVHHYVWDGYLAPGARIDPRFFLIGYEPMAQWYPGTDPTNFMRCSCPSMRAPNIGRRSTSRSPAFQNHG